MKLTTQLVVAFWLTGGFLYSQVDHFEFAEKPRLVNCGDQPCFRIVLNALDVNGTPTSLEARSSAVRQSLRVFEGDEEFRVFHVRYLQEEGLRGNCSLVLIDYSGSMRSMTKSGISRFEAARAAAENYISNMQDQRDRVGVVFFEPRTVIESIRTAEFYDTKEELLRLVEETPTPASRNNTPLYSAILEGLERLQEFREDYQVSLVVLSDGENDIRDYPPHNDPPGLVKELARVEEAVKEFGIQVVTIGFGVRGSRSFDEESLRAIAYPSTSNYAFASDLEGLSMLFQNAWKKLANRMQISFGPVRDHRDQLAGRDMVFRVSYSEGPGREIPTQNEKAWVSPGIRTPGWEGELDLEELRDFRALTDPGSGGGVQTILLRMGVFAVFLFILLGLWFGLPRSIWPERYVRVPTVSIPSGGSVPVSRPSIPRPDVANRIRRPERGPESRPVQRPRPPRAPERRGPRQAGDATIYIPPDKGGEGDS